MKKAGAAITVLAGNTVQRLRLLGERGLSLWIETSEYRAIFDAGQGWGL